MKRHLAPHRIVLIVVALILVALAAFNMNWQWIAKYRLDIWSGIGRTIGLLIGSSVLGFPIAVFLGLAQVSGGIPSASLALGFCTIVRGTPILLQFWLLYYGVGSLFPYVSGLRQSWIWPYLTEAWPYALTALTISFAGYEGEIMRGALQGVPKGELDAAKALGMRPIVILYKIWLPRAIQCSLPTLNGELIIQMKSTPLVATISVIDVYSVFDRIRQETFIIYEPLLLLALTYLIIAGCITLWFRYMENKYVVREIRH